VRGLTQPGAQGRGAVKPLTTSSLPVMQQTDKSTAMLANNTIDPVVQCQYQAYTLIGGTVAVVAMTAPLKLAIAAAQQQSVLRCRTSCKCCACSSLLARRHDCGVSRNPFDAVRRLWFAQAVHPKLRPCKRFDMSLCSSYGVCWLMAASGGQDNEPYLWQSSSSWWSTKIGHCAWPCSKATTYLTAEHVFW
jgi:hypothetical protein